MLKGKVKSFSADKGYGFIAGESESYFFHVSDLPKDVQPYEVKKGMLFTFDDVPSPKGMQAKQLSKIEQKSVLQPVSSHIVRREPQPKYGEVILRVQAKSPFFKDPQDCRDALINGAKTTGCNAVLGLKIERETWSSGNYRHTMHWARGDLCLVAENKVCSLDEKHVLESHLEQAVSGARVAAAELVKEYESRRFWQKFPWAVAIILVIVVFFIIGKG